MVHGARADSCTSHRQSKRRAQEERWAEQGEGGWGQGFLEASQLAWLFPSCPCTLIIHQAPEG